MTALLISDLHLDTQTPEIAQGFLAYLEQAKGADALYLLGDIFDAWIGDDVLDHPGLAPIAGQAAEGLRRLSDSGTAVYFIHGNRDFLLGERFAREAGMTLLSDPVVVTLGDKRTLLMHGDTLCTRDVAYQTFRQQSRDPQWQSQILAMPIDQRIELARSLRLQSGEATSTKASDIMDVTQEEVERVMEAHDVTTLIHGHTHRPAEHELTVNCAPATRIVLGDWQPDHGWEVRAEAHEQLELRQFALPTVNEAS